MEKEKIVQILCVGGPIFIAPDINPHEEIMYEITTSQDISKALNLLEKENFDILIIDEYLSYPCLMEFLEKTKKVSGSTARVIMSSEANYENAIQLVNRGLAHKIFMRDCELDSLRRAFSETLGIRRLLCQKESGGSGRN